MDNTAGYLEKILEDWEQSIVDLAPKIILAIVILVLFVITAKIARSLSLKFYTKFAKTHVDVAKIIAAVIYFFSYCPEPLSHYKLSGLKKCLQNYWPEPA